MVIRNKGLISLYWGWTFPWHWVLFTGDRVSGTSDPCGNACTVIAVPGPGGSGAAPWYGLAV